MGTGILLAVLGTRPLTRLLAWAGACILLVLTSAALTAANYVLEGLRGTNARTEEVTELLGDGLEIFRRSAASTTTALGTTSTATAAAVALIVGAVGATLLERTSRARAVGQDSGSSPNIRSS